MQKPETLAVDDQADELSAAILIPRHIGGALIVFVLAYAFSTNKQPPSHPLGSC